MQKRMLTSMTGPKIRSEIKTLIAMSDTERDDYLNTAPLPKLAIISEMVTLSVLDLDRVYQAIVWELPNGKRTIEIQRDVRREYETP